MTRTDRSIKPLTCRKAGERLLVSTVVSEHTTQSDEGTEDVISIRLAVSYDLLREAVSSVPGTKVALHTGYMSRFDPNLPLTIRAYGESLDQFEPALDDDSTIAGYERLFEGESLRLYRIDVADMSPLEYFYDGFNEFGGRVVSAITDGNEWTAEIEFPTRALLSEFWDWYIELAPSARVYKIQDGSFDERGLRSNLTAEQSEAIQLAYENGYFDIPRRITIEELAAMVDISSQAYSQRLRRGLSAIIGAAWLEGNESV